MGYYDAKENPLVGTGLDETEQYSPPSRIPDFSERDLEIFTLTVEGLTAEQIGLKLRISEKTVKTHKINVRKRILGASNRNEGENDSQRSSWEVIRAVTNGYATREPNTIFLDMVVKDTLPFTPLPALTPAESEIVHAIANTNNNDELLTYGRPPESPRQDSTVRNQIDGIFDKWHPSRNNRIRLGLMGIAVERSLVLVEPYVRTRSARR